MTTVVWRRLDDVGLERCTLRERPAGADLDGTVIAVFDGRPAEVRWSIDVDESWVTRRAHVQLDLGETTRVLDLTHDGKGRWQVDGRDRPELQGCVDLDLEITPATNTLPIRRLGDSAEIEVAWVRFPSLELVRSVQRYERLGERRWRFSSGACKALLEVTPEGLVRRYQNVWEAVTGSFPV